MNNSSQFSLQDYQCFFYSNIHLQDTGYYCDLGKNEFITQIKIILAASSLGHFEIYTSLDAKSWQPVQITTSDTNCTFSYYHNEFGFLGRFIYIKSSDINFINALIIFVNSKIMAFKNIALYKSPHISKKVNDAIVSQQYERNEIEFVLEHIEPNDVILELGGSLGAMSSVIKKNNIINNYYCIEANPQMIELMKINHRINNISGVTIIEGVMSLYPKTAEVNFYLSANCWASSLSKIINPLSIIKVKTYCFQSFVKEYKPNFIICDIEHGEYDLFRSPCDLSSVNKICIEIHGSKYQNKIYTFFSQQGFTPIFLPEKFSNTTHVNFFQKKH